MQSKTVKMPCTYNHFVAGERIQRRGFLTPIGTVLYTEPPCPANSWKAQVWYQGRTGKDCIDAYQVELVVGPSVAEMQAALRKQPFTLTWDATVASIGSVSAADPWKAIELWTESLRG